MFYQLFIEFWSLSSIIFPNHFFWERVQMAYIGSIFRSPCFLFNWKATIREHIPAISMVALSNFSIFSKICVAMNDAQHNLKEFKKAKKLSATDSCNIYFLKVKHVWGIHLQEENGLKHKEKLCGETPSMLWKDFQFPFQLLPHFLTVKWPDCRLKNQQTIAYCLRCCHLIITYLSINAKSHLACIVKLNVVTQIYLKEDKCTERRSHTKYRSVDLLVADVNLAVLKALW